MPTCRTLNVLQKNANDIGNKKIDLKEDLHRRSIYVALMYESKLEETSKTPHFNGFMNLRQNRAGSQKGLLTLISKFIPSTHTTYRTLTSMPVD